MIGMWPRTEPPSLWWSTERPGQIATNSELQRWFKEGSIIINYRRAWSKMKITGDVYSIVIHPKSKKNKITVR
jgi:hypothetical protein